MSLKMPRAPAEFQAQVSPAVFQAAALTVRLEDRNTQAFINIMSFFVYQAKQENRYREFLATVCGRVFGMWPEEYAKDLPAHVAMIKTKIHTQFKGSYYHQKQIVPQIHWENFLSLSIQDIAEIGTIIMTQAEVLRSAAFKKTPALRKDPKHADAQDLAAELRGRRRRAQHAATEVPTDSKDPEGKLHTIDVSDIPDDIPDKDSGMFVEVIYDLTVDDDDLDDEDYVPSSDEEADMFLSD